MYIRKRDADDHTELAQCCTCGKVAHWKHMDCGHYISRGVIATRFHPANAHAQCVLCNRHHGGKTDAHRTHIIRVWGEAMLDELEGMKNDRMSFSAQDLLTLAAHIKKLT